VSTILPSPILNIAKPSFALFYRILPYFAKPYFYILTINIVICCVYDINYNRIFIFSFWKNSLDHIGHLTTFKCSSIYFGVMNVLKSALHEKSRNIYWLKGEKVFIINQWYICFRKIMSLFLKIFLSLPYYIYSQNLRVRFLWTYIINTTFNNSCFCIHEYMHEMWTMKKMIFCAIRWNITV